MRGRPSRFGASRSGSSNLFPLISPTCRRYFPRLFPPLWDISPGAPCQGDFKSPEPAAALCGAAGGVRTGPGCVRAQGAYGPRVRTELAALAQGTPLVDEDEVAGAPDSPTQVTPCPPRTLRGGRCCKFTPGRPGVNRAPQPKSQPPA